MSLTKKWTVTTETLRNLMKNVPGPHDEAIYGSMVRDFIDWVERVLPDDSQVEPTAPPVVDEKCQHGRGRVVYTQAGTVFVCDVCGQSQMPDTNIGWVGAGNRGDNRG